MYCSCILLHSVVLWRRYCPLLPIAGQTKDTPKEGLHPWKSRLSLLSFLFVSFSLDKQISVSDLTLVPPRQYSGPHDSLPSHTPCVICIILPLSLVHTPAVLNTGRLCFLAVYHVLSPQRFSDDRRTNSRGFPTYSFRIRVTQLDIH